jgi:ADP-sugar diphosphatase
MLINHYNMSQFKINNIVIYSNIETIQAQMETIIHAPKLKNYVHELNLNLLDVKAIRIDAVKWFCAPHAISPEKLGFLFMEVECVDKFTGLPMPGVVFLRGGSIAVYIIIEVEGKEYVVLTSQVRVPCGKRILEIPAGMLDASSNFAGVAMKEITEETGLKPPNINELVPLFDPIIPSGGGCDECIQLYFWKTTVTEENLEKMKSSFYGVREENESISLEFIALEDYEECLCSIIRDVKAISAHFRAKKAGLLN